MRFFAIIFLTLHLLLIEDVDSSETSFTHESDECIGYYHFGKHTPLGGSAIYFSWSSDPMPMLERIGAWRGGCVIYDHYDDIGNIVDDGTGRGLSSRVSTMDINIRWRYVTFALAYDPKWAPFDEFVVYHSAEKNPPREGQECYFISLTGRPLKFAHEAISCEHVGVYKKGGFYKNEGFPIQNYPCGWESRPWLKGEKAPGVIYWREAFQLKNAQLSVPSCG